jgi:hypothetical protein
MTVTVFNPPTAPVLTTTFVGNGVQMSWSPSQSDAGISAYLFYRRMDGPYGSWGGQPGNVTGYLDTYQVIADKTYAYYIQALDVNGVMSPPSNVEIATTMTFADDPLHSGLPISGAYYGTLRKAIDALRRTAGLPLVWTSYGPATGPVTANDMIVMRTALDEGRAALGLRPVLYHIGISAYAPIRAQDLQDVREGVK